MVCAAVAISEKLIQTKKEKWQQSTESSEHLKGKKKYEIKKHTKKKQL